LLVAAVRQLTQVVAAQVVYFKPLDLLLRQVLH
jgi:hypothetical protein